MSPAELAAIRERAEHTLPDFSMVGQHMAERDRAALLAEVERLATRLDKVRALAVKYGGDHMCGDSPEHCGSCVATEMLQATDGSDQ